MDFIMSGKGTGEAVTDRMKYGFKPSAVRSSNFTKVLKASNPSGSQTVALGNQITFDLPNLGTGYYVDWSTSYFRFGINVQLGTGLKADGSRTDNGYVRFARGPESMFRRVEYADFGGATNIEDFENYNDLYCATELMTSNSTLRSKCGMYHGEGLLLPHNHFGQGDLNTGLIAGADIGKDYDTLTVSDTRVLTWGSKTNAPLLTACNPMDQYNGGYHAEMPYLRYPDLGGIICAHRNGQDVTTHLDWDGFTRKITADDVTVAQTIEFSRFMEATQACVATDSAYGTSPNVASNVKYVTFQTVSSFFGGSAEKYIPMAAIKGMRITFSLDKPEAAFVVNGLNGNTAKELIVTIVEPCLIYNCVYVDPTVDQALISSARSAGGGSIRLASQTWRTFSYVIPAGVPSFEQIIPIRVSSLKAVYFTFSRLSYSGLETFESFAYRQLHADSKDTWFDNCLESYQFIMDGTNLGSGNVTPVRLGYSEAISELERSLHIGMKSANGEYLSLLCNNNLADYRYRNFILGQEFESFSNKGPVIESGMNTINAQLSLKLFFDNTNAKKKIPGTVLLPGNVLPPSEEIDSMPTGPAGCFLKIFCMYDAFLDLEPDKTMKLYY